MDLEHKSFCYLFDILRLKKLNPKVPLLCLYRCVKILVGIQLDQVSILYTVHLHSIYSIGQNCAECDSVQLSFSKAYNKPGT